MDKSVSSEKKLFVADPHGFCNGVKRALKIVEDLLEQGAVDIYIYNDMTPLSGISIEYKGPYIYWYIM